jgi:hypothetical protein
MAHRLLTRMALRIVALAAAVTLETTGSTAPSVRSPAARCTRDASNADSLSTFVLGKTERRPIVPDPNGASARVGLLLGVRGEIESAIHCVSDDHALHHLNGALAMLDGAERDLETVIADAYKHGFADSYAKQVIAEMNGEPDNLWCAVEGCHEPPTLYDLETQELVCRGHLDYGAEADRA